MTRIELRLDGPHSNDYTEELARGFAEVVRTLNHATMAATGGLTYPATVYTLAGQLAAGTAGLDQLFRQVTAYLVAETERLANDDGNVVDTVARALEHLGAIRAAAAVLARELSALQSATSGLYLPDPDHPDGASRPDSQDGGTRC